MLAQLDLLILDWRPCMRSCISGYFNDSRVGADYLAAHHQFLYCTSLAAWKADAFALHA